MTDQEKYDAFVRWADHFREQLAAAGIVVKPISEFIDAEAQAA